MADMTKEILDRVRRVEIRLTRLMEAQNVETGIVRPVWEDGTIRLPSRMASVMDCLRVVPDDWPSDKDIYLMFKDQVVATVRATKLLY